MKILVCGGRDYTNRARLCSCLDAIQSERGSFHIIQGGADGADALAREWAGSRCEPCTTYRANWSELGRKAGPVRNQRMLDEGRPDLVVVFPGGRGTADMLRRAQLAGVEIMIVGVDPATVSS
jgi:hypothetical protein